ncbi:MAG: ABC transporter ATP-binding protein [Gemmatimonadota bacterium]
MSFFRTEDLVVRYGRAPEPAVNRVTMSVPRGSLYAVLGPNGSGKSTLMRALLGGLEAEGGHSWIGDRDVGEWTRREIALEVGVVSQSESIAFPMTVRELVSMGRYPHLGPLRAEGEADRNAIRKALRWCDATELERRGVTTLSGGEFQRVRIARALAQEPAALALDEPTASLDIRHEMTIFALLRQSASDGMTVLLTTHNLNLASRFADRILLLDQGKVAAEGKAQEVLTAEILERVYRWPVAVQPDPETGAPQVIPRVGIR